VLREGAIVASPIGYINFCQRHVDQCGPSAQAAVREQTPPGTALSSGSYFWKTAFDNSVPASVLSNGKSTPTTPNYNWQLIFASDRTAQRPEKPSQIATPVADLTLQHPASRLTTTPDAIKMLEDINSDVNGRVRREADLVHYGVNDYWELPEDTDNIGDCEDYALEKRALLMAKGVPMSALSIAMVKTAWGEAHAVLLVRTDRGDYGLDNLSSWVKPWEEMGYTWQAVQSAENPDVWVRPQS
jgi:predicted transglutaminase-like cysteine proteinase